METEENTRAQRIWGRMLEARDRTGVSLSRAKSLTVSWQETGGLPTPIRRAKAFERIVSEIPIYIDDEQLLVGDFASRPMWAEWYCEFSSDWVLKDIESEEALKSFQAQNVNRNELKEIAEYWRDKNVTNVFYTFVKPEKKQTWLDMSEQVTYIHRYLALLDRLGGYHIVNYEKAIKKGFRGILAEVEEELQNTVIRDDESLQKATFLKAAAIVLKAGIHYAERYARLARELAERADDRKRREELLKIADICERVPANPTRTFPEAVQTLWFVHALIYLETRAEGRSPGRADQYLYPYYKSDIESGRLNKEEAVELLECFRIKLSTLRQFSNKFFAGGTSGEAQFHNITLGGQTPDGQDATNELSYLFLEAATRTRTPHPTLSIRVHDKTPEDFALKGLELVATGIGFPAFFSDKSHIPFMMEMGATLEEARGYAIGGCVVPQIPGTSGPVQPISFHLAKCLDLALHDGIDILSGKQVGPETGKFEDFDTFDEVVDAYKRQVTFFSREAAEVITLQRLLREQMICPMFNDVFIDDCIKRGKSSLGQGSRYTINYHNGRTMVSVVDSLAAVKKCVFDDRSIGKRELIDALKSNFEGHESVRKLLLAAPKFGNDDDHADNIAADLYRWWQEMATNLDAAYGGKYMACAYSVGGHVPAGEKTAALPSGRFSGKPLADGSVSPTQGADIKGPTAVINSCSKIDQSHLLGTLLNMKFPALTFKTKADRQKLFALVKTYFDNGGKHIQFNTVDRETLLDAQKHPELHRNLIVRVSGYSAFFTELSPGMQEEIIARTEHSLA